MRETEELPPTGYTPVEQPGRGMQLYRRALRYRCPHCGGGPIRAGWFRMRRTCATCGLRTDRGEQDFFLGAMMFNIVLAEGLLALVLVGVVVAQWPAVPWRTLGIASVVLAVLAPFVFYTLSHALWLASDILIRPVTGREMAWHHAHPQDGYRPEQER
ncbi:MAG TPA: DUF983 domain-containing protein [Longimicrobium sp.]|nr:DUF983 domain-containing protein [Longimicrobium sp.]